MFTFRFVDTDLSKLAPHYIPGLVERLEEINCPMYDKLCPIGRKRFRRFLKGEQLMIIRDVYVEQPFVYLEFRKP